jgi:hypothetical protein
VNNNNFVVDADTGVAVPKPALVPETGKVAVARPPNEAHPTDVAARDEDPSKREPDPRDEHPVTPPHTADSTGPDSQATRDVVQALTPVDPRDPIKSGLTPEQEARYEKIADRMREQVQAKLDGKTVAEPKNADEQDGDAVVFALRDLRGEGDQIWAMVKRGEFKAVDVMKIVEGCHGAGAAVGEREQNLHDLETLLGMNLHRAPESEVCRVGDLAAS